MSRFEGVFAGLATVDVQYLVDRFPGPNEKIAALRQAAGAGGPAANAAVAFAHFAGHARLVTAIGNHPLAHIIRADLNSSGVTALDAAPSAMAAPPVSSICTLEATGERMVVSANAGAFGNLDYDFDAGWLDGVAIVLTDGHHLDLGIRVAAEARKRGIPVVLDGGSWKPGLERLLAFVDVAVCSADFSEPAEGLQSLGVREVAVTRGGLPILYWHGRIKGEVPVRPVRAVDTLGAGDIFHGAFCWSKVNGAGLPEALGFAAAVATESCLHWGTREWRASAPRDFKA